VRRKILVALITLSVVPIPQTTILAWTAQVVNESGIPQVGVTIREVWQNYTLETTNHEQALTTGENGIVVFPRRVLWRPLLMNASGFIRRAFSAGARASFGPVAYLIASRGGEQSFADHCQGCVEPNPRRLVLHSTH